MQMFRYTFGKDDRILTKYNLTDISKAGELS